MAGIHARPCTLILSKEHSNTNKSYKNGHIKNGIKDSKEEPNLHQQGYSIPVSYNTEKEYYQLVYLTKADTNYGTCEDNRSETDTPINDPKTFCSFPKGCHKDSFQFCVFRNLSALGLAVMFINTGYLSMQTMQSSVHAHTGYGVLSVSCVYAATIISCLLAIAFLKKWSQHVIITVVSLTSIVYFVCNSAPESHLYLIIPGSFIYGLSQGLMWISLSAYITRLAYTYATKTDTDRHSVLCKFNGITFGIISSSYILCYVLSSTHFWLITQPNDFQSKAIEITRDSATINRTNQQPISGGTQPICGAEYINPYFTSPKNNTFLEADTSMQIRSVHNSVWFIYCLLCIVLSLLAIVIVLVLLRRLPDIDITEQVQVSLKGSYAPLRGLRSAMCDHRLQMLCPIILFTAFKQGFVLADYTQAYITCALQLEKIGLVMLSYGTVCTLGSYFVAVALTHLRRYFIVVAATLFEIGNIIVLYLWSPHPGDAELFYVVAACMGVCDAIWQTLLNVLLGDMFQDMPVSAFSAHRIIYSSGLCITFAYSHFLAVPAKLCVLSISLAVGISLYGFMELRTKLTSKTYVPNSNGACTNSFVVARAL